MFPMLVGKLAGILGGVLCGRGLKRPKGLKAPPGNGGPFRGGL